MNSYTKTPVNTVWFDAILALALGLLVFAGDQAINAVFAISVTGLYIAYAIPISARFLGTNNFKPGPFNLGIFVRHESLHPFSMMLRKVSCLQSFPVALVSVLFMLFLGTVFLFPETPNPAVEDMNYTVVVLGGVMVLSLAWYYFPKYGGVHWFTGPVSNIGSTSEVPPARSSAGSSTEYDKKIANVDAGEVEVN
jgi:hypothetical protein